MTNKSMDLNSYLKDLPPGLERAVLRVLQKRIGLKMAISRPELVANVHYLGFTASDRQIRSVINQLRKEGHLICSTGGPNGGYWLAKDWGELRTFLENEVHPRAMDLLETEEALKRSAEERWGIQQLRLFEQ